MRRTYALRKKRLASLICSLALASIFNGHALAAKATNSGSDDVIYQLRTYEIFDRNKEAFHTRFRDHAVRIMRKHGFDITSTWEARSPERTEFVYVIRWPDEATMRDRWAGFMADQEWSRIKAETGAAHGAMVGAIEEKVLRATAYSPGQWR